MWPRFEKSKDWSSKFNALLEITTFVVNELDYFAGDMMWGGSWSKSGMDELTGVGNNEFHMVLCNQWKKLLKEKKVTTDVASLQRKLQRWASEYSEYGFEEEGAILEQLAKKKQKATA
eukprot:TRINITY_DN116984_c0_g1_i1.p1 TRINITY_DN116984_c0_g1~~TRINITY_DN116984_c0_g1_i1.p1  ORF type:complete len:118 (-),score=27.39 TRINITY_DN116984_c0_g1_i1:98-451(-)